MTQQYREQIVAVASPIYRQIAKDVRQLAGDIEVDVLLVFCDAEDFFPWVVRIGNDQEHLIEVNGVSVRALLNEWTAWGLNAVRQAIEKGVIA